jgi:hypothetical protein
LLPRRPLPKGDQRGPFQLSPAAMKTAKRFSLGEMSAGTRPAADESTKTSWKVYRAFEVKRL